MGREDKNLFVHEFRAQLQAFLAQQRRGSPRSVSGTGRTSRASGATAGGVTSLPKLLIGRWRRRRGRESRPGRRGREHVGGKVSAAQLCWIDRSARGGGASRGARQDHTDRRRGRVLLKLLQIVLGAAGTAAQVRGYPVLWRSEIAVEHLQIAL
ncbi:unnamed protein product [Trichogramma brassicae]|uniref:Uncharacterized protein n=1 Tax=Trichogramma brassicae TaxID=86971 RepID=A0A6H5IEC7_9HYME|nr:unnamed protein product [Trichogramma brassicae]